MEAKLLSFSTNFSTKPRNRLPMLPLRLFEITLTLLATVAYSAQDVPAGSPAPAAAAASKRKGLGADPIVEQVGCGVFRIKGGASPEVMQTLLAMYDSEATGNPEHRSDYTKLFQPCNGQMFHNFDTVFVQLHPVWWLNLCENLSTNPDFRSAMQFDEDDMAIVEFKKFVAYEPFMDEHGKIQRGRCDAHKDNIGPKMGPVFIKLRHPERNNKNSGAFQTLEAYVIHERCCKTTCQNAACSSFEHCLEHITDPKVAGPLTDQFKLSWDTGKRSRANLVNQAKERKNAAIKAFRDHRSLDRLEQDLEACNTKSMELKHNGRPVKLRGNNIILTLVISLCLPRMCCTESSPSQVSES